MKTDKIKELLNKYYAGETSLEEEATLRKTLDLKIDLPDYLKKDVELFAMMNALNKDSTTKEIDFEHRQESTASPNSFLIPINFSWAAGIAAGFSLIIVGVFVGWMIGKQSVENYKVSELRQDISEMKQLVTLSQLRKESASERIMATYKIKKLDSANDEILDALIYTFNNDENSNVKNAAADALFKFGNHSKVRQAFINGLSNQTDPILQIKLIDMLVGLNEKRALPKLQEMMMNDNHMKVVKQKAAQGIGQLI